MSNYSFSTFGNVLDEAYDELALDGTTTTIPGLSSANMQKWGNRYAKAFLSDVDLKTREATTTLETVADTTLSAAASSGATTLTITSATGWPSSGLCVVENMPMSFTRSSTTLTVSAVTRDYDAGASVQLALAIPSDFLRPVSVFIDNEQFYLAKRGNALNVPGRGFSLYGDYFVFPLGTAGGSIVTVHYMKKGANALATTDTMEIMDYFDAYVISLLVARGHRCMYDDDRAMVYERQAVQVFKQAKRHMAKADGNRGKMFIPAF